MSQALQQRAKDFLGRPVPKGIKYIKGSMAEQILAAYAKAGSLKADDELAEMIELCIMETMAAIDSHKGDASTYFEQSAAILKDIQAGLG